MMLSFEHIKQWVVTKGEAATKLLADLGSGSNRSTIPTFGAYSMVLTPHNIPEFTIPPSLRSMRSKLENRPSCSDTSDDGECREGSLDGSSWHSSDLSGQSQCSSRSTTPLYRKDQSPVSSPSSCFNPALKTTNADPLSSAAMQLTHVKTCKTSYGFDTLAELPHTNCEESLFHAEWNSSRQRALSMRSSPKKSPHRGDVFNYLQVRADKQQERTQGMKHSLPSGETNVSITDNQNHVEQSEGCDDDIKFLESCTARLTQESKAHNSVSSSLFLKSVQKTVMLREMSHSLSLSSGMSKIKNQPPASLRMKPKQGSLDNDVGTSMASLGKIKISLQYLPSSSCLKVILLRAENLGGSKSQTSVNPQIWVSLRPGKTREQKSLRPGKTREQKSKVFKGTANPVINQEFYFDVPDVKQLSQAELQIKVFNKQGKLKKDELLGVVYDSLESLDLKTENRVWRNLIPGSEEYGNLKVQCNLSPRKMKLEVKVISASDLPKHVITGYPNAYVKVTLSQPRRQPVKQITQVKHSLSCPVFNETFVFDISPRVVDLKYTTVTLTVYRRALLCSDEVIGQVRLGYGSTQHSELLHWNTVLQALDSDTLYNHKIVQY